MTAIDTPFLLDTDDIARQLKVHTDKGLTSLDVEERLRVFGKNTLREQKQAGLWSILLAQFNSLVVYLLLAAAVAAFLFNEIVEGVAVLVVILVNAAIGCVMEFQAMRSMIALHKLTKTHARVRRNGQVQEILSDDLVPGDILLVEAGDVIAADARIITSRQLEADESTLTGESMPVAKNARTLEKNLPLADRINMLFKGTSITHGNAEAVVVGTGIHTELGTISELMETATQGATPLEEKLNAFSRRLVWIALILAIAIALIGLLNGKEFFLVMETAIALAVAAIPEGMPIVATIALARGMIRLAERNVIVRRLSAVETLGGTNIICTDKTGTLTENKLTVHTIDIVGGTAEVRWAEENRTAIVADTLSTKGETFQRLVEVMVLCNNATYSLHQDQGTGDPLEIALLKFAFVLDQRYADTSDLWPRIEEEPFDSDTKIMVTLHASQKGQRIAAKGAPEAILNRCSAILGEDVYSLNDEEKSHWLKRADELSTEGMRVLAFADRDNSDGASDDLVFLGLVGFLDPPRSDVAPALHECGRAGIKVIMVTGDHPSTALSVAAKLQLVASLHEAPVLQGNMLDTALQNSEKASILRTRVFARVSPKQKLDLISFYQDNGDIVAMTGDGVNDAPALRKADIGIAMGRRGTQIAREAATMVLEDDAFPSIVEAVKQGRIVFDNIRRFVIYLLSCNISEIFVVAGATFVGLPLPLLPLQILFLNLVTDVFPALALGVGSGHHSIMHQAPRHPKEPIISRAHWISVLVYGGVMTLSAIGVMVYCSAWLRLDPVLSNNITFLSVTLAQLCHVFNIAPVYQSFWANDITRNKYIWLAQIVCILILVGAFAIEPVQVALSLSIDVVQYWDIVLAGAIVPALVNQALKRLRVVW